MEFKRGEIVVEATQIAGMSVDVPMSDVLRDLQLSQQFM